MKIRTRFAPSPTGYLHIGGARTALFAWLFARHHGGEFILRIEDTDRERSTEESIQAIFQGMQWLGLDWDEEPVYQTQRYVRYAEVIAQLLAQHKAYRCYCSKERLEQLRNQQQANGEKPRYDGLCRQQDNQNSNQPYVVRFKNPQMGSVAWEDSVHGYIEFQNSELDDLIIQRSDGTPTYNFTVVIDDMDMQMTHVLRGDDHINNTPRQINLFHALGATLPTYAHLPMILGSDGKRLSKRHGAVSVMQYKEEGYLPEALLNYLARLGWSHGDQEIFSREELIKLFDVKHINKSAAIFNPQKLTWINQQYLQNIEQQDLVAIFQEYLPENIDKTLDVATLARVQVERYSTLKEMAENSRFCFKTPEYYDEKVAKKHFSVERIPALQQLSNALEQLDIWRKENISHTIKTVLNNQQLKMGQLGPAVRIALTGNTQSPDLATTIYLIGQADVKTRLQKAIEFIQKITNNS